MCQVPTNRRLVAVTWEWQFAPAICNMDRWKHFSSPCSGVRLFCL